MRWFLGILVVLAAALALESGLLAYAMYVLLGVLLLSRFMAREWVEGLSATRECAQSVAEVGERVPVRLTVRNAGWLPAAWVLIEDVLPRRALDRRFPQLVVQGKRIRAAMIRPKGTVKVSYELECVRRGYHQIGPAVLESGDLFGLHRRFRLAAEPAYLLVLPKVVAPRGWDLASRRPIGEVRLSLRLYEDPTRIAGIRRYEPGDPLNRIHWKATARTGQLHTRINEPSSLAGATIFLDFHDAGYPPRGEPARSELAVTAAASLAHAVCELNQQIGLVTNGRDAADRLLDAGWAVETPTLLQARQAVAMSDQSDRLRPQQVETRRGVEQFQRIREMLARLETTDGLTFADLVGEAVGRVPRDATVLAILPRVPEETAIALGNLRRAGLAVSVVLILLDDEALDNAYARLMAEGIRDVRHLRDEDELTELCQSRVERTAPYDFVR
jgi:uncharacterized protein (DUF58 family)